jgi:hypothetical protein
MRTNPFQLSIAVVGDADNHESYQNMTRDILGSAPIYTLPVAGHLADRPRLILDKQRHKTSAASQLSG